MTTSRVTSAVVDGNRVLAPVRIMHQATERLASYQLKVGGRVDGETLDRSVLDVEVLNDRVRHYTTED